MRANFTGRAIRTLLPLMGTCMVLTGHAAGSSTGNMTVSADIGEVCAVTVTAMQFGDIVPGANVDTEAVVSVICTAGTTYTLDLGDGMNHVTTGGVTGNLYRRQMASGTTNRLPYMVYQETGRITEIAGTAALTAAYNNLLTSTVGNGSIQTKSLFGRIVGTESANKPAGSYVDTVVITIAF